MAIRWDVMVETEGKVGSAAVNAATLSTQDQVMNQTLKTWLHCPHGMG